MKFLRIPRGGHRARDRVVHVPIKAGDDIIHVPVRAVAVRVVKRIRFGAASSQRRTVRPSGTRAVGDAPRLITHARGARVRGVVLPILKAVDHHADFLKPSDQPPVCGVTLKTAYPCCSIASPWFRVCPGLDPEGRAGIPAGKIRF